MEKYRRVIDPKSTAEALPTADHIVRINVSGKLVNYIGYAEKKLGDGGGLVELVALGRAINRAVTVAEILRRNYAVHQVIELHSVSIRDRYEPLEEGLRTLEMKRTMSSISITLAKSAEKLDTKAVGYAPPLDNPAPFSDQVIAEMDHERSNAKAEKQGGAQATRPKKNAPGRKGRNKGKAKKGANPTASSNTAEENSTQEDASTNLTA